MLDQLIGLLLIGLGIHSSPSSSAVKGETTETYLHSSYEQKEALQQERKRKHEEIQKEREAHRTTLKDKHALWQQELKEKREDFLIHVATKREEAHESAEHKKEAFHEKIKTFRDAQKKQIVGKIQEKIEEAHEVRLKKLSDALTRMTELLERLTSLTQEQKTAGKDTTRVDAAITAAQTAITTAQAAIAAQAGKEYVVTVTSEEGVKQDIGVVRKTLESDLSGVHNTVMAARKAVQAAIATLATLRGETVPKSL
jgi:DNA repair exonuclease SbcCD ATPase subunit